jgi:hypothetical protein
MVLLHTCIVMQTADTPALGRFHCIHGHTNRIIDSNVYAGSESRQPTGTAMYAKGQRLHGSVFTGLGNNGDSNHPLLHIEYLFN